MSKNFNRLFCLVLAVVMLMSIAVTAFAADYSFAYYFANDDMDEIYVTAFKGEVPADGYVEIPDEIDGYKVVGPNGNSIFLPAAGYRLGTSTFSVGWDGGYWSGSPNESNTSNAYTLRFDDDYRYVHWDFRYNGRSVRPVSE